MCACRSKDDELVDRHCRLSGQDGSRSGRCCNGGSSRNGRCCNNNSSSNNHSYRHNKKNACVSSWHCNRRHRQCLYYLSFPLSPPPSRYPSLFLPYYGCQSQFMARSSAELLTGPRASVLQTPHPCWAPQARLLRLIQVSLLWLQAHMKCHLRLTARQTIRRTISQRGDGRSITRWSGLFCIRDKSLFCIMSQSTVGGRGLGSHFMVKPSLVSLVVVPGCHLL